MKATVRRITNSFIRKRNKNRNVKPIRLSDIDTLHFGFAIFKFGVSNHKITWKRTLWIVSSQKLRVAVF